MLLAVAGTSADLPTSAVTQTYSVGTLVVLG